MAGFECTYALSEYGTRFDLLSASKHDLYCKEDYLRLKQIGIGTVREGFSWAQIDKGNGVYDYSRFIPMLEAASQTGIEQIWDFNHFDFPSNLDVLSDEFVSRFREYAVETIKLLRKYSTNTLYVVLQNEISYFSWIAAQKGLWAPYLVGTKNSTNFKIQLIKATIAATKAIREIDSNVRFIQVEPLMYRKAKRNARKGTIKKANEFNKHERFQTWDILSGKTMPEIGGSMEYLDVLGINYYISNQQWVLFNSRTRKHIFRRIPLFHPDRLHLSNLLSDVWKRYEKPLVITETGSYGDLRKNWWAKVLEEIQFSMDIGISIDGVCAYPILDNPAGGDFVARHSGLWDFEAGDKTLKRVLHEPSYEIIKLYLDKWNKPIQ